MDKIKNGELHYIGPPKVKRKLFPLFIRRKKVYELLEKQRYNCYAMMYENYMPDARSLDCHRAEEPKF